MDWTAKLYDAGGPGRSKEADLAYSVHLPSDAVTGGFTHIDTMVSGVSPVTEERFHMRRAEVYELFKTMFEAETIILTLGLVESWYDAKREYYWQWPAGPKWGGETASVLELRQLDFKTSYSFIERSINTIRARNPAARFILSTSPVPLIRTFAGPDVRSESMLGKSILRAVAGELAAKVPLVDYFPSYEAAQLSPPDCVWADDRRHVTSNFVRCVGTHLKAAYIASHATADTDTVLAAANALIRDGKIKNAEDHLKEAFHEAGRPYEVSLMLGELAARQHAWAKAMDHFRTAHRKAPEKSRPLNMLARAAVAAGAWSTAENAIAASLKLQPNNPKTLELAKELRGKQQDNNS